MKHSQLLQQPDGLSEHMEVTQPRNQPLIEKFFDSFLNEKNIRWLLVIGAAIVFVSSLMLVVQRWSEWPTTIQFLTILGYTATLFGLGEFGAARLGLKSTGRALRVLTLLLLPLACLSLSFLSTGLVGHRLDSYVQGLSLLVPTAGLLWIAAKRSFDDWLRGPQTTFIVSYLLLALAEALPRSSSVLMATMVMVLSWLIMTVGVVKVNRRVFWLVEEHRAPRIFGFLPSALLGAMFLLIVATKVWGSFPIEWFGLGCVAVAGTILGTTRTIANVFRQRTGDLVRPLPWNIVVPMVVGVMLIIVGVVGSFHGFSYVGTTTYAVVPTTILASILVFALAAETQKSLFVWIGLILATVAYQSAPTCFQSLVETVKTGAAASLSEEKLPLAFYGLTYLPLIIAASLAFRTFERRKQSFLTSPIQIYITILSLFLYALALTHLKAALIVSFVNVALFSYLAIQFRDRMYLLGSIVGCFIVAAMWSPFVNTMGWFDLPSESIVISLASLATFGLLANWPNRLCNLVPCRTDANRVSDNGWTIADLLPTFPEAITVKLANSLVHVLSLQVAVLLGMGGWLWLGLTCEGMAVWNELNAVTFAIVIASVAAATFRYRNYLFGGLTLSLIIGAISACALSNGIVSIDLVAWWSIIFSGIQTLVMELRRRSELHDRPSIWHMNFASRFEPSLPSVGEAFCYPLADISYLGIFVATSLFHLPQLFFGQVYGSALLTPLATSLAVLWLCFVAISQNKRTSVGLSVVSVLCWLTSLSVTLLPSGIAMTVWPCSWLVLSLVGPWMATRLLDAKRHSAWIETLQIVGLVIPAAVVGVFLYRSWVGTHAWSITLESLTMLVATAVYFFQGLATNRKSYYLAAGLMLNVTLAVTWYRFGWQDYQMYFIPVGLSLLGLVELFKREIPSSAHEPMRYFGALTILVSPVFQIVHGSWWHLLSLLILSVLVVVLAIGLKVRALVYTGTAFLLADLIAMPIRASIDNPMSLWIGGLATGASVIVLAAICERHRETLLSKIRLLSAELAAWE
jgi:hypothetical protein